MPFSYLKLQTNKRMFVLLHAAGHEPNDILAMIENPRTGELGVPRRTYEDWLKNDAVFREALDETTENPDWAHEHIFKPWTLALDDATMVQRMLGVKAVSDPEKPFRGLGFRLREQILNESRKLNRDEATVDKFEAYLERMERTRQKLLAEQQRLQLAQPSYQIIEGETEGA